MSKYREELKARLSKALGKDCGDVVDELYALGVMDDSLARKGCAVHHYLTMSVDTSRSDTVILSEIAETYGTCEVTAWRWVRSLA